LKCFQQEQYKKLYFQLINLVDIKLLIIRLIFIFKRDMKMTKNLFIMLLTTTALMSQSQATEDPEVAEAIRRSLLPEEQVTIPQESTDDAMLDTNSAVRQQAFLTYAQQTLARRRTALNDLHKRFCEAKSTKMTSEQRDTFREEHIAILLKNKLPDEDATLRLIIALDRSFANTLDANPYKTKAEFEKAFDEFWRNRQEYQLSFASDNPMLLQLLLDDALIEREHMIQDLAEDLELITKAEDAEQKRLAEEESKQIVTERATYKQDVRIALDDFIRTVRNDSFEDFQQCLKMRYIDIQKFEDILLELWGNWIMELSSVEIKDKVVVQSPMSASITSPMSADRERVREHWSNKYEKKHD
jgi:hypothetical protein